MRVLGHRGAPLRAVENTLEALGTALDEGADGVEFDVRLCGSGALVVCHDETLARLTGAAVRVASSSAWALGRSELGGRARVPTLDEVLAMLVRRGAYANVEVKSDATGHAGDPCALARATYASLERAGLTRAAARDRVVVSSFDPRVLVALRALAPGVPRGALLAPEPGHDTLMRSLWARVAPRAVHPCGAVTRDEEVARFRALGYAVNAWTVDDEDDARRLVRAGVSALITNDPGRIREAIRSET